jgi:hypothetical protein
MAIFIMPPSPSIRRKAQMDPNGDPYPGLEIDCDPRLQRREWVMQRVSWLLLLVLLILIACGLFGKGGPMSLMRERSDDGSVLLEYERFIRYHSPDMLRLTLQADADKIRIRLDSGYARDIRIEQITPTPEQETSDDGSIAFLFNTQPGAQVQVVLHFEPIKYGKLAGWIAVDDKPHHPFSQFVYP